MLLPLLLYFHIISIFLEILLKIFNYFHITVPSTLKEFPTIFIFYIPFPYCFCIVSIYFKNISNHFHILYSIPNLFSYSFHKVAKDFQLFHIISSISILFSYSFRRFPTISIFYISFQYRFHLVSTGGTKVPSISFTFPNSFLGFFSCPSSCC